MITKFSHAERRGCDRCDEDGFYKDKRGYEFLCDHRRPGFPSGASAAVPDHLADTGVTKTTNRETQR